jgi:hypothetical protein
MKTPVIHVSVEHGGSMEPIILIYDADQSNPIQMNHEAAHKLLEDLFTSIELVESLMPRLDDVSHLTNDENPHAHHQPFRYRNLSTCSFTDPG